MEKKEKVKTEKKENAAGLIQNKVSTRGRTFEGIITKKFHKRIVIEFEKTIYVPKYQRFYKKKTRLHARLPDEISVEIGDFVKIKECRPLSKLIHFILIEKIRSKKDESN